MQSKTAESIIDLLRHFDLSDNELSLLLLSHFGSSTSNQETKVVYYPGSPPFVLRLEYCDKGRIEAIYAEEGFSGEHSKRLIAMIEHEMKRSSEICRVVLFSRFRSLQGSWRYKDQFQILPVPPEAPRPGFTFGDHPFLLEFSYAKSPDLVQNAFRRGARAKKLTMLLNALLVTPITSYNFKSAGPKGWSWVLLPRQEINSPLRIAYCQHFYDYQGLECAAADFTGVDGSPPIKSKAATEYYAHSRPGNDEEFEVPADLHSSLERYFGFPQEKQARFLQACFWLSQARDNSSASQGFLAAIQAIEALIPSPGKHGSCGQCGKDLGPSRTKQFITLLENLVPSEEDDKAIRRSLYKVRSDLSHGFASPFLVDMDVGGTMNPKEWQELDYVGRAIHIARVALHKWLHLP